MTCMFRPARIRHYLAVMQLHGHAAGAVLAGSGIEVSALMESATLVSLDQYRSVVANMLTLTGNGGIAFELGSCSEIADLGLVGYAMISSTTVRQALSLWIRYSRSLVGTCWSVRLLYEGQEQVTVEIVEELPTAGGLPFCVEEFVAMTQKIGGALAGEVPVLQRIDLSYSAPKHAAQYHEVCQCPVRFSAPRTEITLAKHWVDKALRGSDREFNDICLQNCSQIMRQIAQESSLLARLRMLLLRSPSAIPTLDEAAVALAVSGRTLRRQLQEQGHSYYKLVTDFRTELACEYLRSSSLSAKEIGYLLGFTSSNAFRRAFKSWTGCTISVYRGA